MQIICNDDGVGFNKEEERAREISGGHWQVEGGETKAIREPQDDNGPHHQWARWMVQH